MIETFKRLEQKYILNEQQYKKLLKEMTPYLLKDKYFVSNIRSIYFDTNDYDIIKKSLEKPIYKEKIRIRSYNKPNDEDEVFFEIKKKYKGITNKRRISVPLIDLNNYLNNGIIPNNINEQIIKEIDYCIKFYKLKPVVFIAYDRNSYCLNDNDKFRITFDNNIRYRLKNNDLKDEINEKLLFDEEKHIMEIKALDSIPIWLVRIMSKLEIYPSSFSKYGNVYIKHILKEEVKC